MRVFKGLRHAGRRGEARRKEKTEGTPRGCPSHGPPYVDLRCCKAHPGAPGAPQEWEGRNPAARPAKETLMKKTAPRKMTLTRETLHHLTDAQAQAALGGSIVRQEPKPLTTDSKQVCCA